MPTPLPDVPAAADTGITIYHNPKCGTSRNVLALLCKTGVEPEVIEYLKTPPTREKLVSLIAQMALPVREMMRQKEPLYSELALDNPALGDDALVDAMLAHPILINRPIVVTPLGTRLCRPSDLVLGILSQPQLDAVGKAEGELPVTGQGPRVAER